jgi:hypothetical protein
VREPLGKHTFGRAKKRWEDNIRLDIRTVCSEDMRWMELWCPMVGFNATAVKPSGSIASNCSVPLCLKMLRGTYRGRQCMRSVAYDG